MPVLLDTDVAIELLRGNPKCLSRLSLEQGPVCISTVTASELYFGAFNSAHPAENAAKVDEFLADFKSVSITSGVARRFGSVKAELRRKAVQAGPFDLLIASIALENGCSLATGNVKHFRFVPDLRLENWIRG